MDAAYLGYAACVIFYLSTPQHQGRRVSVGLMGVSIKNEGENLLMMLQ